MQKAQILISPDALIALGEAIANAGRQAQGTGLLTLAVEAQGERDAWASVHTNSTQLFRRNFNPITNEDIASAR